MSYVIPSDIEQRTDTRATHIRNCHHIAKEAANLSSLTSGWGGPGEAAFDHLQDVSRMMQMEVAIRLVEDKLLDMGYNEQDEYWTKKDEPLITGEYTLTARSAGSYWVIEVKHNPELHSKHELMRTLSLFLSGYSGPSWDWEDGFTDAGPVWVK